ncbi:MAG: CDP-alcohol phosphatidyltransferase family protein [Bacteroidetes bacterium]|nr:CDP-alcohol phosphatidyltransferase family protein [Bacteroidota bacterium]MCL5034440.1 CDP-alcohol phosphatidyltransferase family protein [Bacteroidota bacterium]
MDDILSVEKRWTVSNILSLSRIVLLIPIVVLILRPGNEYRIAVLALMLLAAATDFLDGLLARTMHQVTDFGRLLDPVADKICIITGALALVIAGDVPLWYAILVGMRDIIIVIGSLKIMNRRKVVVQSVWTGKWAVSFIAAYLILATLKIGSLASVKDFFLYLSTIAVFVSLFVYTRIYRERMAKNGIA